MCPTCLESREAEANRDQPAAAVATTVKSASILITDGRLVYCISKVPKTSQERKSEPNNASKITVTVHDPAQKFKTISQINLTKKGQPFIKGTNDVDIFKKTGWATNGEVLICFWKNKV